MKARYRNDTVEIQVDHFAYPDYSYQIEDLIESARAGRSAAGFRLLFLVKQHLQDGAVMQKELSDYLQQCIDDLLRSRMPKRKTMSERRFRENPERISTELIWRVVDANMSFNLVDKELKGKGRNHSHSSRISRFIEMIKLRNTGKKWEDIEYETSIRHNVKETTLHREYYSDKYSFERDIAETFANATIDDWKKDRKPLLQDWLRITYRSVYPANRAEGDKST